MKFGKKKRDDRNDRLNKEHIRAKIWKDPSIIEDIFADKDWQTFEGDPSQDIPSTRMANYIDQEVNKEKELLKHNEYRSYRLRKIIRYSAVAASVLFLFSFGLWHWSKTDTVMVAPIFVEQQQQSNPTQDTAWISITNNKPGIHIHTLPDQSTVRLFAKSTLRYIKNFSSHNREIYLDGKAYFSVTKDPSRPFSVYAGETKTTALGTSFTINTHAKSKLISVELHTGKVVVASLTAVPTFDNVLLNITGESISIDKDMRIISHNRYTTKKPTTSAEKSVKEKQNSSLLKMDNIPLSDVMIALEAAYNISIKISEQEISKIQYTASIDPQRETIQDVLAVICLINDLRYVQNPDGSYMILRQDESIKELNTK